MNMLQGLVQPWWLVAALPAARPFHPNNITRDVILALKPHPAATLPTTN